MLLAMLRDRRGFAILVGVGCLLGQPLPAFAGDGGFHLVTGVKGNVQVQRQGQKNQQVFFGYRLKTADKLLLGKGGTATVLCQNLRLATIQQVGSFEVAKVCQVSGRLVLQVIDPNRIPTRSSNDRTIPYIISPRNTVLIEARPLLRWNPVVGSKSYRVLVTGPDLKWETTAKQSQVAYEGEPLKSGVRYRVMVTAENGESSQSDTGVGFSVLDSAEVKQIKSDISALQGQELSEEAQVLAIAHLERSNELYGSAIDRLKVWLARGNQSATVSQLAGDLNRQVGLPGLARDHYVVGLEMMRRDGNLVGQAEVLNSLGQVDETLDQLKSAINWLIEAQEYYRSVGDLQKVQELDIQLNDLNQRV
jgi:hypothetical protein